MGMSEFQGDRDIRALLEGVEGPVEMSTQFRSDLSKELRARLAPRRGEGPAPEGWALCPFDVFCFAEQRLPNVMRVNCPCLRASPALRFFRGRGLPLHARPCAGRRLAAKTSAHGSRRQA